MNNLNIEFKLDRIHCHDEGDGWGNAEPYLWTVFFKVDGDTCVVNSDGASIFLQGTPTVITTPGNHGNLGDTDVDEGDDVNIPSIIGEYRTMMKPIPLTTPLLGVSEVGGMIGCITVLMEEDDTSNSAIQLGHEALDRSVRERLQEVMGRLSVSNPEPTEEDFKAMSDAIGRAVQDAISHGVSIGDWILAFGNMDDKVGSEVFRFSHNGLEAAGGTSIPFSKRWNSEGDWEIFGHIKATIVPRPRQDDKCCDELKKKIKDLEAKLAEHGKRIFVLERPDLQRAQKVKPQVKLSKTHA